MNRVYLSYLIILVMGINACKPKDPMEDRKSLYDSKEFTVYSDGVVQGNNEAKVISPTEITSNYKSLESETFSRNITFKFSLNEKDNEMPVGVNHTLVIDREHESPIITFGEAHVPDNEKVIDSYLPANYPYTFRLNLSPVLRSFEEKGYYESFDGTRVAKDDFKGVYIAGGANPLTWDFVNLANKGLLLTDQDQDSIYTLTVTLNPLDTTQVAEKTWKLSEDLSDKPTYTSDQPLVDALFNMSLEEAIMNIEEDSTLRTGAKWGGVWTRDVSYSILLAFAYHEPEVAKISLMRKVKRNRIVQDTGSGGAWPVSSDRTTWALAAWELYKITGDRRWLSNAFGIIQNSLEDDEKTLASASGLYRGESSFLDWREQTYPKWMSNKDIYISENLGTNVVHYQAHQILGMMAKELDVDAKPYFDRAASIKKGINEKLWIPEKGYYGQYLYGREHLALSPRFEALGEALAVLFDVTDQKRANSIFQNAPLTPFGTTCIYPQIPNIPPYHNNGIWPFVQSYWNWAAAKAGNEEALTHGLASIYRAGALFLTNYENFVADNGDYMGTEINSHRMLWSMAGNLAMVHRVFIGMNFEKDGIRFAPAIPKAYQGTKTLSNFRYRNMTLKVQVEGYGNKIQQISLDGEPLEQAFIPHTLEGEHTVLIKMDNQSFSQNINLVKNKFTLPTPQATISQDTLRWGAVANAQNYEVFKNGELWRSTQETYLPLPAAEDFAEYQVRAMDQEQEGSFLSEPIRYLLPKHIELIQIEQFVPQSRLPYTDFTGRGFVETSTELNRSMLIDIEAEEAGEYLIDIRYSNGTGPWNTDNNCGIRSVYLNDEYLGVFVFPQRGMGEWSDWGYSNAHKMELKAGKNQLRISFETWNKNMDGEINKAMLDHLRVVKL